jgi:uncharacterized protein YbjT (DUF2867 family)
MDNFLRQTASIRQGAVSGTLPADLRMPWIATKDIAAAAARYLVDHTWTGQDTVDVLGGDDLSHQDVAEVLTDVLGMPVHYQRGDRAEVKAFLVSRGYSEGMAQSVIDMDIAGERGINNVTPRTADNTTATTFRQFAEEVIKPAVAGAG